MNEQKISELNKLVEEKMSKIKHVILVMSGKGGVGKTTISVNLAYTLALSGKDVGILDVDIHGPNIAKMLGIEKQSIYSFEFGIEPVKVSEHLKAVSIALTGFSSDQPIIWRGPMKTGVIRQFLGEVNWGELDYLIIDSPPGTGDEPLSVCQMIPNIAGAVIVTTPQDVAILDSRKSVLFAKELNMPVIGIIENMSGFICPHCHKTVDIFKRGGGENAAVELKVPFLGRIPLEPKLVESGDAGTPFASFDKNLEYVRVFNDIVKNITDFFKDKK